ncbi:MAG: 4-phosphoerythronate dehydrogenase [Bacteroides sp.]|nr:4-phosphoerythronate dehydrogenase [Bacteroides sp.]
MKAIVESKIPFLSGLLADETPTEVIVLPANEITPEAVRDADALFVRTRTRCDAALLEGSAVKFIATATIGTDHIDLDWCKARGITVVNAPGCNAPAVAQWVFAAAEALAGSRLQGLTLGVVGVGHVGSIVSRYGESLGMKVMECDPPKGLPLSLEEVAYNADILTFHTPLTTDGQWPTRHMFDSRIASLMKPGAIVMNAARGPVTDTRALLEAPVRCAIDCWEGEPAISQELLEKAEVATPHIAGYSSQGKMRATIMVLEAYKKWLGLPPRSSVIVPPASLTIRPGEALKSYDIMADTRSLKAHPDQFENLRNSYNLRHEL